jgi:presenilin-like A22 family membrane protease
MTESLRLQSLSMLFLVMAVQILALAVTPAISASQERVFEDPTSAANPIYYMLLILAFTAVLLLAIKKNQNWMVSGFIQIAIASSIYYLAVAFMPPLYALLAAAAGLLLVRYYPEWYVIDGLGIAVSAGISSLFGLSMTIIPALILLVILAVYDAISVYRTRHMVSLAEGVIKMKAPLLFVVPKSRGYSFRQDQSILSGKDPASEGQTETASGSGKRGAFFLGLGDAIIPTILVISANTTLPPGGILGVNIPALGAMMGTYLGFILLMSTSRDRPQAGLPFLNSGVMLGFLVGCALAGVSPF